MSSEKSAEIAAITAGDVADFVRDLVMVRDGHTSRSSLFLYCPKSEGRKLALAKRHLESMVAWKPDSPRVPLIQEVIDAMSAVLKAVVVDEAAGYVALSLSADELNLLAGSVGWLTEYEVIRASDSRDVRRSSRGRR